MNRAPAFQFYVKDWLCDPQLRCASPATRGIWIDLLCFMWLSPEKGNVTFALHGYLQMLNVSRDLFIKFIDEARLFGFADVICNGDVTNCNSQVTVINRRMMREEKDREKTRLRVQRHRTKSGSNAPVTAPSSSSSPINKESERNLKTPNPAIKLFLDWWCKEWQIQFNEKYTVKGDKEGTLIKGLLKNHLIERLKELAKEFMKSNDPFVINSGYTIGVFASQVNRLISTAKKAAPAKQTRSGIPKKEFEDWKGSKVPLPKEVKVLVDNLKTKWTAPTKDAKGVGREYHD